MKEVCCPQCKFIFGVNVTPKYTSKKLPNFQQYKERWNCPACDKYYDVAVNICPYCGIDYQSKEFDDICKQRGIF